jgi:uncharacterized protein YjbJ (UPF0337 family)
MVGRLQSWCEWLPLPKKKHRCPRLLSLGIPVTLCCAAGVTTGADNQSTIKEMKMNWDRIEGNWKEFKGNVKEQWGKLTEDQLDVIAGKRDHLAGKIQTAYGISKDETEKQITDWQKHMKEINDGK